EPRTSGSNPYTVEVWTKNVGAPWTQITDQSQWAWIPAMTRVWTTWSGSPAPASWAFEVAIPKSAAGLSSGLDFGSDIEMWYTLFVQIDALVLAQYHWPRGRPDVLLPGGTNMPDPDTTWTKFATGSSASCVADVALASTQIGTTNSPPSQIQFTQPPSANAVTNTFFARPTNVRPPLSGQIPPNTISARFFVANWGSQP